MMATCEAEPPIQYVLWHLPNSYKILSSVAQDEAINAAMGLLEDEVACTDLLLQAVSVDGKPAAQWYGPRLCNLTRRPCPLDA